MNFEWSLRQEVLAISHRWPYPLLAFLIGCLAGWGASFLFPPSYRAETRITVAYNADAYSRNPDDYKNWQMRQLDVLTESPEVLESTLTRLNARDDYWNSYTVADLQEILNAAWRNTGIWRLTAVHADDHRASEAVQVWSEVIMEAKDTAIGYAAQLAPLNSQMYVSTEVQSQLSSQITSLQEAGVAVENWSSSLDQEPPDRLLDEQTRWEMITVVSPLAEIDPSIQILLNDFPAGDSMPEEYQSWLGRARLSIGATTETLRRRFDELETERQSNSAEQAVLAEKSFGLASTLVVEKPFTGIWQIKTIRPTALLALVGGLLGLIIWASIWIVRLSLAKQANRNTQRS